jgi:hypothetical protein
LQCLAVGRLAVASPCNCTFCLVASLHTGRGLKICVANNYFAFFNLNLGPPSTSASAVQAVQTF